MRKRKKGRKLSRERDQRKALKRSLLEALFLREKITTTEAKAREVAPIAEKYITKAKRGGLHERRLLARVLSERAVKKLVTEIALRYGEREGGYTRIIKLGPRKTDGAKMAVLELVE